MDCRGHWDKGICLWYLGEGEDVVISCNPGQMERGWPQRGNGESLPLLRQQKLETRYRELEKMEEFDS